MKTNFALLGNFSEVEAKIIESLLKEMDISVAKEYPGIGEPMRIYTGISQTGVSLYVPESELDKAKELIQETGKEEK